mmetsp:Transcript_9065/g.10002  ORF Transcript_9065/g.10002 Transcript_9065/m.10002 type:complete len:218 (+) Transcript_9065:404-1057(+)
MTVSATQRFLVRDNNSVLLVALLFTSSSSSWLSIYCAIADRPHRDIIETMPFTTALSSTLGGKDIIVTAAANVQVCIGVRTKAFADQTALKKIQNDTPLEPQIKPAKSKSALGMIAKINIFRKALFSSWCSMALRVFDNSTRGFQKLFFPPVSSPVLLIKENGSPPEFLMARARKKGTVSPMALPVPLQNPGIAILQSKTDKLLLDDWDHSNASLQT